MSPDEIHIGDVSPNHRDIMKLHVMLLLSVSSTLIRNNVLCAVKAQNLLAQEKMIKVAVKSPGASCTKTCVDFLLKHGVR